ncbi:hypothetical protein B0G52_10547 [Cohnella sp. SGD-V74]|nr:hypothetical protein B0G52_10547 [Cohnella sp. SGD-V74]
MGHPREQRREWISNNRFAAGSALAGTASLCLMGVFVYEFYAHFLTGGNEQLLYLFGAAGFSLLGLLFSLYSTKRVKASSRILNWIGFYLCLAPFAVMLWALK